MKNKLISFYFTFFLIIINLKMIYTYEAVFFYSNFMYSNEFNNINNKPYYKYFFDIEKSVEEYIQNIDSLIEPEKIKLYDSYLDKEFVQKMQKNIYLKNSQLSDKIFEYSLLYSSSQSLFTNHNQIFYKIINKEKGNYGFFYKENQLNYDHNSFYFDKPCSPGGLYSCQFNELHRFRKYGTHVLPVIIPYGVPNYFEEGFKRKSPILYALPSIPLNSMDYLYLCKKYDNLYLKSYVFQNIIKPDSILYSNEYEINRKILHMIDHCIISHHNNPINYYHIKSDVFYWNFVKKLIHDEEYKKLYNKIIKQDIKNNHKYLKPKNKNDFRKLNIANLFYIFHKKKDPSLVLFLKEYLFPMLIENNLENNIHFDYDIDFGQITDKIKNKLKTFFSNDKTNTNLFNLIKDSGAIISGSFLLEILMKDNNKIKSNDIDIYLHFTCKKDAYDLCRKYGFNDFKTKSVKKAYNMNEVELIIDFYDIQSNKNIQLIFVNYDNPSQFIEDNFDFDSCMNSYSIKNNNLKSGHPSLFQIHNMTISDKYMNKIFVNKDNYSIYRAAKTIERAIKYIQRGFKITNLNIFLDNILSNLFN